MKFCLDCVLLFYIGFDHAIALDYPKLKGPIYYTKLLKFLMLDVDQNKGLLLAPPQYTCPLNIVPKAQINLRDGQVKVNH